MGARRNKEDNRCKTNGVETYKGRSICKTHYKSMIKDKEFWNSTGGDYDNQVGRFRDGYYDTYDEADWRSHHNFKTNHNDTDTY